MSDEHVHPGPLAPDETSEGSTPGRPEPDAEEVESARLLADSARAVLRAEGFEDEPLRRLADASVALDLGQDTEDFIPWARERPG
jgi:hypothetical protein